jgi:hypothetical protein
VRTHTRLAHQRLPERAAQKGAHRALVTGMRCPE